MNRVGLAALCGKTSKRRNKQQQLDKLKIAHITYLIDRGVFMLLSGRFKMLKMPVAAASQRLPHQSSDHRNDGVAVLGSKINIDQFSDAGTTKTTL